MDTKIIIEKLAGLIHITCITILNNKDEFLASKTPIVNTEED
ncbi:hypothetical protein V1389_08095 [Flavobacterium rakeshii]|nr:hypothetical protein [Flavobacterium rakeshii]MEE1898292.1 hypothetical protein [Flavobacterium rakeshii]